MCLTPEEAFNMRNCVADLQHTSYYSMLHLMEQNQWKLILSIGGVL